MDRQNILLVASASLATVLAMLPGRPLGQLANQLVGQPRPTAAISGPAPEPAPQQETRVVPESQVSMQQSFAPVVRRTAPAVVNVYSSVTVRRSNCPYANDPVFSRLCGNAPTQSQ